MFKTNESGVDRGVRLVLGVLLLAAAFFWVSGVWTWLLGIVGVVMLVTGAVGMCPLYSLLGISTNKVAPKGR